MVLSQKMTHPPISCEKSFESSYWRVGTFTYFISNHSAYVNVKSSIILEHTA